MASTKKVRMMASRGNPTSGGVVIRAGAIVELPEFWADRFIADGSAELVTEKPKADTAAEKAATKSKGKTKK